MNHTHAPEPKESLTDGDYLAFCKEKTLILASANGHGAIFPQADCVVIGGEATFRRDGEVIWHCSAEYAATHFHMEQS